MTTENKIDYEGNLTLNTIIQECLPLNNSDILDTEADLTVSLKMTDNRGRTILLLEAKSLCINESELLRNTIGCYIVRFDYVEQLLHQPFNTVFEKFIRSFITNIKYKLTSLPDSSFQTHYQYVWCDTNVNNKLLISEILGLKQLIRLEDYIVYKGDIPQE